MAGSVRNSAQVVDWLHRLEAEPYRFGFLPVMRKLEAIYTDKPRLGEAVRASEDPVRLAQNPESGIRAVEHCLIQDRYDDKSRQTRELLFWPVRTERSDAFAYF